MSKKKTDFNTLRKRAEAYLAGVRYEEKDFSELDMKDLLHELHIHHAELEVQNEELNNALDELEAERNRYLDLFESAPVGYAVLDDNGIVQDANMVLAQMLGVERRVLIGRNFSRFVGSGFRSSWYKVLQALGKTRYRQVLELSMQAPDEAPLPVRLEGIPVRDDGDNLTGIRIAVSDISSEKTAEADRDSARKEAGRQREENLRLLERFRMVAENTNSAIFICDAQRFRFVNTAAEHLTGLDRESLMDTLPWRVLKPTNRAEAEAFLREALENQTAGRTCTLTLLTPDGEERPVEITINQVFDGGQSAVLGTAIDVTAHKLVENELKERLDARTLELTETLRRLEEEAGESAMNSHRVAEKTEAAEALRREIESLDTAMNVLLRKRQADRRKIEENITANLNRVILPEIQTLRTQARNPEIRRCLDLLEKELEEMTSGFACALTGRYNLSATEIRIANLIKEGLTSDEISEHLNLASKTISYHRNNIRKKLGLHNKKVNLQTHLLSLS